MVAGGRGGVGRAIRKRFEAEGAIVYARDLSDGGSVGGDAPAGSFLPLKVTGEAAVMADFAHARDTHGRLDILVNAAGIESETTTLAQWNQIFAINFTGTFLTSKHALQLLRKSEGDASIINFGSYNGFIADPELAAYCATKGAVHALTKAMEWDHSPECIRVKAVCPGYVDTPMLQSFFQENSNIDSLQQAVRDVRPLRTFGTQTDIANLVNWLASDEARYASSQLWLLDGGLSAQVQQMRL